MNCRGHDTRQRIVRDYEIHPEAHIKLLTNQQKHSDAGATIEDEYYVFSAKRKELMARRKLFSVAWVRQDIF